ncbi:phasin family protein [Alkalilimnicola ehrlichii]|uniref:phasin family protein n=1 Tax=Alkalilimnicola ehrlichii TaxID=351052 RepID=UPI003BA24F55
MQDQMMNQMQEMMSPVRKLNALMLDNTEKLVSFQLDRVRSYADLGIKQMRAALEVNDSKSLQSFMSEQTKLASTLSQQLTDDAKTLATMGEQFGKELQKVSKENISTLQQTATQTATQAASRKPA